MRNYINSGNKIRYNTRNTGMAFENCINTVNNFYQARGLGLIQKQHTPFIPIRDRTGKVVDVKVAEKAISDYAGIYGKYAVAFEAKSSIDDKFEFNRLKQHQLDTLEYYHKLGHIAFLFLSFSEREFYILPYPVVAGLLNKTSEIVQWKTINQSVGKYKYITKDNINSFFKIPVSYTGSNITFLDYMTAAINIYTLN